MCLSYLSLRVIFLLSLILNFPAFLGQKIAWISRIFTFLELLSANFRHHNILSILLMINVPDLVLFVIIWEEIEHFSKNFNLLTWTHLTGFKNTLTQPNGYSVWVRLCFLVKCSWDLLLVSMEGEIDGCGWATEQLKMVKILVSKMEFLHLDWWELLFDGTHLTAWILSDQLFWLNLQRTIHWVRLRGLNFDFFIFTFFWKWSGEGHFIHQVCDFRAGCHLWQSRI